MFKVEIHQSTHYWNKFAFKFDDLEDAEYFAETALNHFFKEEGDEDAEDMVVIIDFRQEFTTAKEEENESNSAKNYYRQ